PIELLRPVPMQPIELRARTLRPGKKVQLVEGSVLADGTEVVRATALRIRVADIDFADPPADRLTPGPGARRERFENLGPLNFGFAMEMSMARGEIGVPGPAAVWFRLAVPVVAGEEPTPLMRVAAAADFGNGISGAVTWDEHLFINPDLTIYLHRLPAGGVPRCARGLPGEAPAGDVAGRGPRRGDGSSRRLPAGAPARRRLGARRRRSARRRGSCVPVPRDPPSRPDRGGGARVPDD